LNTQFRKRNAKMNELLFLQFFSSNKCHLLKFLGITYLIIIDIFMKSAQSRKNICFEINITWKFLEGQPTKTMGFGGVLLWFRLFMHDNLLSRPTAPDFSRNSTFEFIKNVKKSQQRSYNKGATICWRLLETDVCKTII
jgi:hypothetical protein